MGWITFTLGIAAGIAVAYKLPTAAAVGLGVVGMLAFFGAVSYALSHYDECGDCAQTAGADITFAIASFCAGFAPAAIVLCAVRFVWMLARRRSD